MTRDELMQIGHDAGFDTSELTGEVIALLECVAEHAEAKERAARIEAQQRLADMQELAAKAGLSHMKTVQEAVAEAVAAELEACAELMEQQHTWITNVAASALIRSRPTEHGHHPPCRLELAQLCQTPFQWI